MITLKQKTEIAVLLLAEFCLPELQVAIGGGYFETKQLMESLTSQGKISHLKGGTYRVNRVNSELERRIGHNKGLFDPDKAREAIEAITEKELSDEQNRLSRFRTRRKYNLSDDDDDDDDDGLDSPIFETRAYQRMNFGTLEKESPFKNLGEGNGEGKGEDETDKKADPYAGMSLAERFKALKERYREIDNKDGNDDENTDDDDEDEDDDFSWLDDDDDDFSWLDDDDDDDDEGENNTSDGIKSRIDKDGPHLSEGARKLLDDIFNKMNKDEGDTKEDDTDDDEDEEDDDTDDTDDTNSTFDIDAFIQRRRKIANRNFERRRLSTREGATTTSGIIGNRIAETLYDAFTVLYSNEMFNINDTQTFNPVAFMVEENGRWYYSDKGKTIHFLTRAGFDLSSDRVSSAIAKVVEMYDCRMVAGEILTKKEIDLDGAVSQLVEFLAMIEHLKRLQISEMFTLVSLDMQEQIRDMFKRIIIENAQCNRTGLIDCVTDKIDTLKSIEGYDRVECFCYEAIRDHLENATDDEFLFFKTSLLNI